MTGLGSELRDLPGELRLADGPHAARPQNSSAAGVPGAGLLAARPGSPPL